MSASALSRDRRPKNSRGCPSPPSAMKCRSRLCWLDYSSCSQAGPRPEVSAASCLVHDLAAHQCIARPPRQLESEKRSVLALALERRGLDHPAQVGIEYAHVGIGAGAEMARIESENARRLGG